MKVNWQLSNQSIRWASSRDYVAAHSSTVTYFLKFSADILFDHGLNSVFFLRETQIRRGYLHAWFVWI